MPRLIGTPFASAAALPSLKDQQVSWSSSSSSPLSDKWSVTKALRARRSGSGLDPRSSTFLIQLPSAAGEIAEALFPAWFAPSHFDALVGLNAEPTRARAKRLWTVAAAAAGRAASTRPVEEGTTATTVRDASTFASDDDVAEKKTKKNEKKKKKKKKKKTRLSERATSFVGGKRRTLTTMPGFEEGSSSFYRDGGSGGGGGTTSDASRARLVRLLAHLQMSPVDEWPLPRCCHPRKEDRRDVCYTRGGRGAW